MSEEEDQNSVVPATDLADAYKRRRYNEWANCPWCGQLSAKRLTGQKCGSCGKEFNVQWDVVFTEKVVLGDNGYVRVGDPVFTPIAAQKPTAQTKKGERNDGEVSEV